MSMSMTAGRAGNLERIFYQGMIVVVIATVVFGFSRSFFLRPLFPGVHAPQEIFFYLHGTVFTLWLALLFTQASLVGAGNVAMHRRLGVAGFVMVPLMVVLGLIGGSIAAHRPGGFIDIPVPPLEFLIVPYAGILIFAVFSGVALLLRADPQTHKRLMLLGTIAISEAGIARWPLAIYENNPQLEVWTTAALSLPLLAWDLYSRKRLHPATVIGVVVLFAQGPVRDMISHTATWHDFAVWVSGLAA